MRVLFTTTPGWGHVHPMVPLARAFSERGDDVAWAAAPEVCSRLEDDGFRAFGAGLGESESMGRFQARFPEFRQLRPEERPFFMFPRLFGIVRAAPMLADLMPIVRRWKPALIVHDAAEFAGPIAAAATTVPSVTHAFGGVLPAERVASASTEVAPLWQAQGLEPHPYGGCYDHLYLDIYPMSLQAGDAAHIPARQALRPVPYAAGDEAPLPEWLARPSPAPLVYVTFGTLWNQDIALVDTVVRALRRFPVRVLVTLGPKADPAALGSQPENVHVARYVPQTQILPLCDLVVSHAGSGTLLAALGHGLPQLCLPQAADQFENAAACVRGGFGSVLAPGAVSEESVGEAVGRLFADAGFRAAAQRVKEEIDAMASPEEVAGVLGSRFGRE